MMNMLENTIQKKRQNKISKNKYDETESIWKKGCIFNIQHYSLQDGAGIRTTVFFKGCPLSCKWCCNPESQHVLPEKMGDTIVGQWMSAKEVVKEVVKDEIFYREEGGMTISGGEPLLQFSFLMEVLKEAKKQYVSVAMETCGMAKTDEFLQAISYLDFLYIDIKCLDAKKHKAWTGASNDIILQNVKEASRQYPDLPICIRTPIIPGFNDTKEDIIQICEWIKKYVSNARYELLPYHFYGKTKYELLQRDYAMGDAALEKGTIDTLRAVVQKYGLT